MYFSGFLTEWLTEWIHQLSSRKFTSRTFSLTRLPVTRAPHKIAGNFGIPFSSPSRLAVNIHWFCSNTRRPRESKSIKIRSNKKSRGTPKDLHLNVDGVSVLSRNFLQCYFNDYWNNPRRETSLYVLGNFLASKLQARTS